MNLHQVLTGAVNPGDHCFSVGSVGEQHFTVSAGEREGEGRPGAGSRFAHSASAPVSVLSGFQKW